MEHLAPSRPWCGPLATPTTGHVMDARVLHHLAHRRQLPLAAVDQQQVRPFAALPVGILLLEPGEAPLEHLAHHREIVAGLRLGPLDVELAIAVLAEALGPGDDHRAGRVGAHDVAVVIDLDPLGHVGQLERVGELAQDLALGRRLGHAPVERFLGIALRLVDQLAPRAALRHVRSTTLRSARSRQRLLEQLAVGAARGRPGSAAAAACPRRIGPESSTKPRLRARRWYAPGRRRDGPNSARRG